MRAGRKNMNKKRIAAAVTSLACCAGVAGYMPQVVRNTSTYAAELVYNDFEANYDGWYGNADAVKLTAENGKGYEASRGMTITGRTSPKDGASSSKGF